MPTIMETVITIDIVRYCDALILPASAARVVSIPLAALAAAIASYESEPTTDSRSHGRAIPSDCESEITVITIAIAGAIVKIAAVIIVFLIK